MNFKTSDCVGCGILLDCRAAPKHSPCEKCGDLVCQSCSSGCRVCNQPVFCPNCIVTCEHVRHYGEVAMCMDCAEYCSNCSGVLCAVCAVQSTDERKTCSHCNQQVTASCPSRLIRCSKCKHGGCSACIQRCQSSTVPSSRHNVHLTCAARTTCAECADPIPTCADCSRQSNHCYKCNAFYCDRCLGPKQHCIDCNRHVTPNRTRVCSDCDEIMCSHCGLEYRPAQFVCSGCQGDCKVCRVTVPLTTMAENFEQLCTSCVDYLSTTVKERVQQDISNALTWPNCLASLVCRYSQLDSIFARAPSDAEEDEETDAQETKEGEVIETEEYDDDVEEAKASTEDSHADAVEATEAAEHKGVEETKERGEAPETKRSAQHDDGCMQEAANAGPTQLTAHPDESAEMKEKVANAGPTEHDVSAGMKEAANAGPTAP